MKVSEQFKSTIKAYLDNMAAVDSLFAPVYQKPTKNIDNCITYILNQVKKSGCCGFSDDEIFGMALHYYQEDNIEVGSPLNCQRKKRKRLVRLLSKNCRRKNWQS